VIRLMTWIAAGLFASFGIGQALADSSDLRTAIEARYAEMKTAMASKDSKALVAILAKNFVSVDTSDKSEDADAMIAAVSGLPTDPNRISETTLLSVRRVDGGVEVEQRYEMNTHKPGKDGAEHAVKLEAHSTDTWIHTHGQWRTQRTITNKFAYYIDGKLVAHKERANGSVNPK
jgi:hypothetical protein